MNYKLINDREEFEKFLAAMPDLGPNESYFVLMVARKKWNPVEGIPSAVKLRRKSVKKEGIFRLVSQWETALGTYTTKEGLAIPLENLGVYMGYNTKSHYKACLELIRKSADAMYEESQDINVESMASDAIQKAEGTKNFVDIDVDVVEGESREEIIDFIKGIVRPAMIVNTSGGFHYLVRKSDLHLAPKNWHPLVRSHKFKSDINLMGKDLIPIPGCTQGGKVPRVLWNYTDDEVNLRVIKHCTTTNKIKA
jgi:hypothetical protein